MASLIENLNLTANTLLLFLAELPFSLLQVIAFFCVWAGIWFPIAVVCAIAINWRPPQPLAVEQKLPLVASLYLIVPVILWGATNVIGVSLSDYGFSTNLEILGSLGLGFGLAVLSIIIVFAIQTLLGWMAWQLKPGQGLLSVLLPILLLALWLSGTEELVFRGFVLTQLRQDYGVGLAAAISSLIFAIAHLVWEQRETIPQLGGLWLMGMVLVLARYVDGGSLGLAWGLHTGWVWAIASLDTLQVITYTGTSPEWVTGKNGKPLAGVAGILCLLLVGITLWLIADLKI